MSGKGFPIVFLERFKGCLDSPYSPFRVVFGITLWVKFKRSSVAAVGLMLVS